MSGAIRLTRWCVGECIWVALSVLLAIAFVTGFVGLAEPPAGELWASLRSPVNIVRIVVLSAALWVWAYIARVIHAGDRSALPRTPRGTSARVA
ncbi:hypothetical protein N799_07385 [Lysobacter arseniciresistens ZS79]|uniref:Uncharacterized protein n=1 Tax=Lysobacter arseniciresistens ZS79 TaxID=913325 RepID=A0A0A0EV72_9GAMM|nr:hypothetical protein [Lysobacter arseniciresistens]KGM54028.1 hypothetical protein N799_07385 [Lysobacter arseniciresistens ZS79]